ncbi:MAG: class I SAM-dependent methyltransferase [Thermoproteota archaeon]|nr:class I SAM-dependent methyltransferase [Thermoproteota archaeon]
MKRLVKRGQEDIDHVVEKVKFAPHLYNWNFYKSIGALKEYRTLALRRFTSEYCKGILEKRYVKAALSRLPFDDKSFVLVLSGHFLFTFADKFDFDFHLSSIVELFRVSSKEVRLYPLQQGMISQPYK